MVFGIGLLAGVAGRSALPALEAASREESPERRHRILYCMEMIRLRGRWVMTAIEKGGEKVTVDEAGKPIHWLIEEYRWSKDPVGGAKITGSFSVDPGQNPKAMTLNEFSSLLGFRKHDYIYEIDGDSLRICGAEPNAKTAHRRAELTLKQERGMFISYWKQVRPKRTAGPPGES
jgi:uncharacterized protein (TIGR03067 family)